MFVSQYVGKGGYVRWTCMQGGGAIPHTGTRQNGCLSFAVPRCKRGYPHYGSEIGGIMIFTLVLRTCLGKVRDLHGIRGTFRQFH